MDPDLQKTKLDATPKGMTTNEISQHLKDHDLKPSYQRIKIYEYLLKKCNHPTVEMIYKALAPKIPTLSKTTVYNTLKSFVAKNLATVVTIEENETRYDADTSIHGHFKCSRCQKIYDLPLNLSTGKIAESSEHKIIEFHLNFKGICKYCS